MFHNKDFQLRPKIQSNNRYSTVKTGEKRATELLRQRISIEIQRGNAASILNTYSDTRGLDEIFYVLNFKRWTFVLKSINH
jgi:hypothetical protein